MQVIPAINATDLETVKKQAVISGSVFKHLNIETSDRWVHIDVADGKFTKAVLWSNPQELKSVRRQVSGVKFEVHLMVEEPEKVINDWLKNGANRVIIHVEAIQNISEATKINPQKLVLALNPETSADEILEHLEFKNKVKHVLFLAVKPGWAGQEFNPVVLEKIRALKAKMPGVIIEIDGGINVETAKLCKEAGADVIVAASYIFSSDNPKERFKELAKI